LKPNNPAASFSRYGLRADRKIDEAVKAYREALRLNPDFLAALMISAGSSPRITRTLCEWRGSVITGQTRGRTDAGKDPKSLDLLAAAYAECQKFPEAATQ